MPPFAISISRIAIVMLRCSSLIAMLLALGLPWSSFALAVELAVEEKETPLVLAVEPGFVQLYLAVELAAMPLGLAVAFATMPRRAR